MAIAFQISKYRNTCICKSRVDFSYISLKKLTNSYHLQLSSYSLRSSGFNFRRSTCSCRYDAHLLRDSIIDHGCAMDATSRTRIFSKFSSVMANFSRPVWLGSPSKTQTPACVWSKTQNNAVYLYFTVISYHK